VVQTRFGRVGMLICYDLEFPEYTRVVAMAGADLLAVPTNWPRADRPDGDAWPEVIIARAAARTNRMAMACCDRTGTERGQEWNEGTTIIDRNGWIAAITDERGEARAELDLGLSRDKLITPNNHLFTDRRPELYAD
jgi:predicted amidohydrolase